MRGVLLVVVSALAASAPARADPSGEIYMGMSAGPSPSVGGRFGAHFRGDGHLALGYVLGGEVGGVQLDFVAFGAGYDAVTAPAPATAALLLFGGDLGRRLRVTPRLVATAKVGLHAATVLRMTDEDQVPDALLLGGWGWSYGLEGVYTFGRMASRVHPNPIQFLTGEVVLEARRERLYLENDDGLRFPGAATLVMLGLRFGAEL